MNINKEKDRTSRARLGHCANRQRGIALATSAAALFATVILPGCAAQPAREQSAQKTSPSAFQERYPGPARPCTVNICGGHRDCK